MKRSGVVMVTVMVVVALAAISAASLLYRMNAEVYAQAATQQGDQAAAAAYSGIQRALAIVSQYRYDPDVWMHNPDLFQHQLVSDDGVEQWYFTIWSPIHDDDGLAFVDLDDSGKRYGLIDASSRIHLNTANEAMLLSLPGMTPELVDALLDWRDRDDNPRPQGAEQDYYSQLERPYQIKNGPFTSVEELLLVRGFTAERVLGSPQPGRANDLAGSNRLMNEPPLIDLLTISSYEPDLAVDGSRRVDLNGNLANLATLELSEQAEQFIRLYRAENNRFNHPTDLLGMRYRLRQDPQARSGGRGRRTTPVTDSEGNELKAGDWIEANLTGEDLAMILDLATASGQPRRRSLVGRVNVNTAPADVLAAIPGIDPEIADRIVNTRSDLDTYTRRTIAWLYTDGIVDEQQFRQLARRLTAHGHQFHVRVVGYGLPSRRFRAYEAIIDVAAQPPRIRYVRDLTRQGMPLAIQIDR